jgi:hypothetical protein
MPTPLAISLAPSIASPWVANAAVTQGDIRVQAGALYTAPTSFTAGATFNAANWTIGAPAGTVYEQNGSGQVIAVWRGNGTGNAATKLLDIATGGVVPSGAWAAGTTYPANAIVANGTPSVSYIALQPSTGQNPATDVGAGSVGTYWMVLGAPGPVGPAGPTASDASILSRMLSDLARPAESAWMIGAGFAQNYRRDNALASAAAVSRQLLSSGGLVLPGGRAISALRMIPTVAIATPLHQFVALYNARTGALLASGTDVTTQAMTANTDVSFPISYTPAAGVEVLAVYYCEATTAPTFFAKTVTAAGTPAPRFGGLHDTLAAGSGPAALPTTLGAVGTSRGPFWVQAE